MLTKNEFIRQLRLLGVKENDTLYLRASLAALGKIDGDIFDVVVMGLLEAVGPNGTILAPAFNKIQNIFSQEKSVITTETVPISGAISKLFLKHPKKLRSSHPSHSFVSIGPQSNFLLSGHDEGSPCFLPIKRLTEIDGKMLLFGCVNESPGFSTVHVAQCELGLSQRHFIRLLQKSWIEKDGQVLSWKPTESPGCSMSFGKFYLPYIQDKNLISGWIGNAYSILLPSARRALDVELGILSKNPTFVECGRIDCLTCGIRGYQKWKMPFALTAIVLKRIFSKVVKL